MKVLVFHIGTDRYALRLTDIARVLPAAALKALPQAPAWTAGLLDLHGTPVPVIDLARLAGVAPGPTCYDSRIVLLDYPVDGGTRPLGLLAEQVVGIDTVARDHLGPGGVQGAPFLGEVAGTASGMLQLVDVERLLPPDVRDQLFQEAAA